MANETQQQNQQENTQSQVTQQPDKPAQGTQVADKPNAGQGTVTQDNTVDPAALKAELDKVKTQLAGVGQEIQNAYLLGQQEALKQQPQNQPQPTEPQEDPSDPLGVGRLIDDRLSRRDQLSEYRSAFGEYGNELSQKFHPAAQGIDKAQLDAFTKQEAARIVDNPQFYPNLPPRARMLQAFNTAMAGRYVPIVSSTDPVQQEQKQVSNGVSDYGGQLQPSQQTSDVIANAERELNQLKEEINKPGTSDAEKYRLSNKVLIAEERLFKIRTRTGAGLQT